MEVEAFAVVAREVGIPGAVIAALMWSMWKLANRYVDTATQTAAALEHLAEAQRQLAAEVRDARLSVHHPRELR